MEALVVVLLTLGGLAALKPTEKQIRRARSGNGRLQERLAALRRVGLVRH